MFTPHGREPEWLWSWGKESGELEGRVKEVNIICSTNLVLYGIRGSAPHCDQNLVLNATCILTSNGFQNQNNQESVLFGETALDFWRYSLFFKLALWSRSTTCLILLVTTLWSEAAAIELQWSAILIKILRKATYKSAYVILASQLCMLDCFIFKAPSSGLNSSVETNNSLLFVLQLSS